MIFILARVCAVALLGLGWAGDVPQSPPRDGHKRPPAAAERVEDRARMIRTQISAGPDSRRKITDARVLAAMQAVPRHAFVPDNMKRRAYQDSPLPIGHGQTISQPFIVALMTELLKVAPESKILEIGTGSAYQAAVLAELTPHVYSVEIVEPLAQRGARTLAQQNYSTVRTRCADGYFGWPEHGPYDAIIVTCAAGHLPPPLWEQLKPGGRIVIPIGGPYEVQRLVVAEKLEDGTRKSRSVLAVRFVPLTRGTKESHEH